MRCPVKIDWNCGITDESQIADAIKIIDPDEKPKSQIIEVDVYLLPEELFNALP